MAHSQHRRWQCLDDNRFALKSHRNLTLYFTLWHYYRNRSFSSYILNGSYRSITILAIRLILRAEPSERPLTPLREQDGVSARLGSGSERADPSFAAERRAGKRETRLPRLVSIPERDFSAQEACHQLLHIPMVECSRTFDSINLPINLTVTRVLRAQPRQTEQPNDSDVIQQARRNASPKLEAYMERQHDLEAISYFNMVKNYQWKPKNKRWEPRRREAVVLIYPKKWREALKKDP